MHFQPALRRSRPFQREPGNRACRCLLPAFVFLCLGAVNWAGQEPQSTEEQLRAGFLKLVQKYEAEKSLSPDKRIQTLQQLKLYQIPECGDFLAKIIAEESDPIILRVIAADCAYLGTEKTLRALLMVGLPKLGSLVDQQLAPDPMVPRSWTYKSGEKYRMLPPYQFGEIAGALQGLRNEKGKTYFVRHALSSPAARDPLFAKFLISIIAQIDCRERARALRSALRRWRDPQVLATIFDSARRARFEDKSLVRDAVKFLKHPSREIQIAVVMYLERVAPDSLRKELPKLCKSRVPEVRLLAVEAIETSKGDPKLLYRLVNDPDWRVRVVTFRSLGRLAVPKAVEALIARLDKETHPRARDDLIDTLRRVTGVDMGPYAVAWKNWWRANKTKVELKWRDAVTLGEIKAQRPSAGRTASYYGLAVLSKRICFLMDSSRSMNEKYEVPVDEGKGRTKAKEPGRRKMRAVRKIDYARENLKKVLAELAPDVHFNIIAFSGTPRPWRDKLVPKTPESIDAAHRYLDDLRPSGSTNIFDTLVTAISDPEVDTIYLLSDGAPTSGTYTETERILEEIRRLNLFRNVKINTIGFNLKGEARELMARLAEENFGAFVSH